MCSRRPCVSCYVPRTVRMLHQFKKSFVSNQKFLHQLLKAILLPSTTQKQTRETLSAVTQHRRPNGRYGRQPAHRKSERTARGGGAGDICGRIRWRRLSGSFSGGGGGRARRARPFGALHQGSVRGAAARTFAHCAAVEPISRLRTPR